MWYLPLSKTIKIVYLNKAEIEQNITWKKIMEQFTQKWKCAVNLLTVRTSKM